MLIKAVKVSYEHKRQKPYPVIRQRVITRCAAGFVIAPATYTKAVKPRPH